MRLEKKYLGEPVLKTVTYLAPWQRNEERPLSDPEVYTKFFRKKIKIQHYHKPYEWNFYVYFIDESKGNIASNRIIWYGYNFISDRKMSNEQKSYNDKFRRKPKKVVTSSKIVWPKHYNEKEIMGIYNKKTPEQKVKILEKSMEVKGAKVHKLAVAMGYYYTDDYDELTWVKNKLEIR